MPKLVLARELLEKPIGVGVAGLELRAVVPLAKRPNLDHASGRIDTSVVVSAALRDRDPEAVLVHVVERPGFEWVATREIVVVQPGLA